MYFYCRCVCIHVRLLSVILADGSTEWIMWCTLSGLRLDSFMRDVDVEVHPNCSWSSLCVALLSRKCRTIAVVNSDFFATTRHVCFTNNSFVCFVVCAAFVGSTIHSDMSLAVLVIWCRASEMFFLNSSHVSRCGFDHSWGLSIPGVGLWHLPSHKALWSHIGYVSMSHRLLIQRL